jgi:hypothetical protein
MTDKQLEKLGIVPANALTKHNRKYWIRCLEIEIKIPRHYTVSEIFQDIWDAALRLGIEQGKRLKIDEIKKCLEIYD